MGNGVPCPCFIKSRCFIATNLSKPKTAKHILHTTSPPIIMSFTIPNCSSTDTHHLYTSRGGGSVSAGLTQLGNRWRLSASNHRYWSR